mgnify:CR=1 FL=1
MNEINFLPVEYRRKSFDRKDQRRQALMVGALFLTIGASYTYQRASNASLAAELDEARSLHRVTLSQFQELHAIEAELVQLSADAGALAYLEHPWPQTQIVAMVAEKVPSSAKLTQLRVVRIPNAPRQRRREDEPTPGKTPFARDEAALRERYDAAPFQLLITGVTEDHQELHNFLTELDRSALIQRAELTSLDGLENTVNQFEFVVTCSLKPGYGVRARSAQGNSVASE